MQHSALAYLPTAFFAVAPELAALDLPQEVRATCSNCAVGAPKGQTTSKRPFDVDLRCCTYHPNHVNWLVGRGLRRGGVSEVRIRARMQDMDGVTVVGIAPPTGWREQYSKEAGNLFGRAEHLRCPYLLPSQDGCAVWRDRGAVCRTWHCRHVDGPRGQELWLYTRRVLHSVERRLAAWCVLDAGPPDESDWDKADVMIDWFVHCADVVDGLRPEAAVKMRDKMLRNRIRDMQAAGEAHLPPVPDYLGPRIGEVVRDEATGEVTLRGTSALDHEDFPHAIFQLLSRLDGKTRWQDAVEAANAVVPDAPFDAALIERLFRKGMLSERDPDELAPTPGVSEGPRVALPYDREDLL